MNKLLAGAFAALVFFLAGPAFAIPSGTLVFQYNSYKHLAANATTVVKASAGLFHGICVNTAGASANTITVYDALTATNVVAIVDGTAKGCLLYDTAMTVGITVVSATGTASDFTVMYK